MDIESENGVITTLYQPQIESFQNNDLEGCLAVTIKVPEEEMIFGALWFRARLLTDLDNRTVLLENMEIINTHFPDITQNYSPRRSNHGTWKCHLTEFLPARMRWRT
jgi:hypothetical protein